MMTHEEIIKKIDEYLTGKISGEEISKWALIALDTTSPFEDIVGALQTLTTLNEPEGYQCTKEEIIKEKENLIRYRYDIKSIAEIDNKNLISYWIGYNVGEIINVIKLQYSDERHKILEHFVKNWNGGKIHSHKISLIPEYREISNQEINTKLEDFKEGKINSDALVNWTIEAIRSNTIKSIYSRLLELYLYHDEYSQMRMENILSTENKKSW